MNRRNQEGGSVHPAGHDRRAFSLIELLVVVSIIAVLAALLLPAIGMVKRAAKSATCATNQRQLFMSLRMYAQDNEDRFPQILGDSGTGVGLWWRTIEEYADTRGGSGRLSSPWSCPEYRIGSTFVASNLASGSQNQAPGLGIIDRITSSVSTYVSLPDDPNASLYNKVIRWSEFRAPVARRVIAGDSVGYNLYARKQGTVFSFGRDASFFYSSGAPSRHSEPARIHGAPGEKDFRANYLHADGHVETLSEPIAAARAKLTETDPP